MSLQKLARMPENSRGFFFMHGTAFGMHGAKTPWQCIESSVRCVQQQTADVRRQSASHNWASQLNLTLTPANMSWIHRQVNILAGRVCADSQQAMTIVQALLCITSRWFPHAQMPSGKTDFGSMFDRMQTWHRHRYRKRARSISDQAMESYLREDVPCGFPMCNVCSPTLPHLPRTASHLVIPNCTILETYLEVFQLPELQGVIYFTSVVKQVGIMTAKCCLTRGTSSH